MTTAEEWFKDNWEKMGENEIQSFLSRHSAHLSESFLREYADYFITDDIIVFTDPNINFLRELMKNDCKYYIDTKKWNGRQVEEFKDYVNWYHAFENNWNLSENFIDKWKEKVLDVEEERKIRYENMKWDTDYLAKMNVNWQVSKEGVNFIND